MKQRTEIIKDLQQIFESYKKFNSPENLFTLICGSHYVMRQGSGILYEELAAVMDFVFNSKLKSDFYNEAQTKNYERVIKELNKSEL